MRKRMKLHPLQSNLDQSSQQEGEKNPKKITPLGELNNSELNFLNELDQNNNQNVLQQQSSNDQRQKNEVSFRQQIKSGNEAEDQQNMLQNEVQSNDENKINDLRQDSKDEINQTTPEDLHKRKNQQRLIETFTRITKVMRSTNQKLEYPPYIIPLNHKLKIIYDFFIIVIILWLTIFIPWQIAYPEDTLQPLDIMILIIFILDIGITMRTTYFDEENDEIIDGKLILNHYIKSTNFYIDVISALPISEIYGGKDKNIVRLLSVIKILRLARLGRLIKLLKNEDVKLISQLIQYVFAWIICFHWITCIWIAIVYSNFDENNFEAATVWYPSNLREVYEEATLEEKNQITYDFYYNFSNTKQYLFSYYSIIMLVMGADIYPASEGQSFYLYFVGIFGWISLAYLFGEISLALQQIMKQQNAYQKKQDDILFACYSQKLPQNIIDKSLEYFEYCWKKKIVFFTEFKDFSTFGWKLQKDCNLFLYKSIIQKVPFFRSLNDSIIFEISKEVSVILLQIQQSLKVLSLCLQKQLSKKKKI